MLSPLLLELLRDWYRIARPTLWLFPGRDPLLPLTTRQFNRVVHAAADRAAIKKRDVASYIATQLCHPPARREDRCPFDSGFTQAWPKWWTPPALYAQVATNVIRAVMSPLDRLTPLTPEDKPPA